MPQNNQLLVIFLFENVYKTYFPFLKGTDLESTALPVFLLEPSSSFALRHRPALLRCRVAHALSVHFSCNSEVLTPDRTDRHVDPESGVGITEAEIKVSRDKVEEFFGDYHCACVAVSGKGSSTSRPAQVTYACKFGRGTFIAFIRLKKTIPMYTPAWQVCPYMDYFFVC